MKKKTSFAFFTIIFAFCLSLTALAAQRETLTSADGAFSYTVASGGAVIISYNGEETELAVSQIAGYDVVAIGKSAFAGNKTLTKVTLPETVAEIDAMAFYNCSSLSEVNIPSDLTKIGAYAFYGCINLSTADFISSTREIGDFAFAECDALSSVTVSEKTISLGTGVFSGCNITGAGISANISFLPDKIFMGCKKLCAVSLSENIKNIGAYAFYECVSLTSLDVDAEHVGVYAFYGCRTLQNAVIGTKDAKIGERTFYGCDSLISVNLPSNIKMIDVYAFASCASLKKITMENVQYIGDRAFYQSPALEEANINAVIVSDKAFGGCTALSSIKASEKLVYVGSDAFKNTAFLSSQAEEFVVLGDGVLVAYTGGDNEHISIPETVKRLSSYKFLSLSSFASVDIPASVEYISPNAFTMVYTDASGQTATATRSLTVYAPKGSYGEAYANRSRYCTYKKLK